MLKFKDVMLKEVTASEDGGTFDAYAATFDREPDCYGDVIAPGAFSESLERWKASGKPIPLLFGHRMDDPLMNIGAVTGAEEDERGLRVSGTFDAKSDIAQHCRRLAMEGRISKLSFAYDILDCGDVELDDGVRACELRKLDIYEVSLVTVPANMHAELIDAKSGVKLGAAISKSNAKLLREAAERMAAASESLTRAMEIVNDLIPPSDGGEQAEPEDEGEGAKADPGNAEAKSREVAETLKNLIK